MSDANIMYFDDGYRAVITYDPDIDMFRGEFIGSERTVFYGDSVESLRNDGEESLRLRLPPGKSSGNGS